MVNYAHEPQIHGIDRIWFGQLAEIQCSATGAAADALDRIERKPGLLDDLGTLNAIVYSAEAEPFEKSLIT